MRVLNLGCARGIHSFYMARSALEVIGIDFSPKSIAIAELTRKALELSNVRFMCRDVRDPDVFSGLPKIDLVIAWGFLHRVSDIFTLLQQLSSITDALSLEWRTPVIPFMSKLRLAYHTVEAKSLSAKNFLGPLHTDASESLHGKHADPDSYSGQTSFWEPTPGAVAAMCRWFGYEHTRIIGYGDKFDSETPTVLRKWAKHVEARVKGRRRPEQLPLARVHMVVEKSLGLIRVGNPLAETTEFPEWDLALLEALRK